MEKKKRIYVPRSWTISNTDESGATYDITLQGNVEYEIALLNGEKIYCTISGVRSTDDEKILIAPAVYLNAGTFKVMNKNLEDETIPFDDVRSITRVSTKYSKYRRPYREDPGYDTQIFQFSFDTNKGSSKKSYWMTVYEGEFVCLAVKADKKNDYSQTRSLYGHITAADEKSVTMQRYITRNGVREIREQIIDIRNLLGIYTYQLEISEYIEPEKLEEAPIVEGNDAVDTEDICEECKIPQAEEFLM